MKDGFFTFEDLEFKIHPILFWARRARLFFSNGFGVSVVKGFYGFGNCSHPYALAVLEGNENNFKVWDDIASYLTPDEVSEYMIEVQKLEKVVKNEL